MSTMSSITPRFTSGSIDTWTTVWTTFTWNTIWTTVTLWTSFTINTSFAFGTFDTGKTILTTSTGSTRTTIWKITCALAMKTLFGWSWTHLFGRSNDIMSRSGIRINEDVFVVTIQFLQNMSSCLTNLLSID